MFSNSLILRATVVSVDKDVLTPSDESELVRANMWGKLSSKGNGRDVVDLAVLLSQQKSWPAKGLGTRQKLDGSAIREIMHQVLNNTAKASRKKTNITDF